MHNRHRKVVVLLLFLGFLAFPLPSADLPSLEVAANASVYPLLVIDAKNETILYANAATAKLFSVPQQRLEGRLFSSLLGLGNQPLAEIRAKTVPYTQPDGTLKHLYIGLQPVQTEHALYYLALLQDQSQHMNLVIRNRILSIALTTLLVIALLFLLFFLFLQVKLTKRIQQQQQKQQYTVQLLQHFLDADNRISYVKDDGGRFIFVNAALEAFLSKPSGELLGKNIEEVASSAFALMTNQSDQQVIVNFLIN